MVITVLDMNFNTIAVVEGYASFIWTQRWTDVGDFELYIPASAPYLDKIRNDFYISCTEADKYFAKGVHNLMVVEKKEYKTDLENGNMVIISGRSVESFLNRRIVWKYDGSITEINRSTIHAKIPSIGDSSWENDTTSPFPLQNAIQYLLDMNVINPQKKINNQFVTDTNRQIDIFKFENNETQDITKLEILPCAYRGDNLYDLIRNLCDSNGISFRVIYREQDTAEQIEEGLYFSLMSSVNHLSSQSTNPYVCFSTEYDNLLSSDNSIDMSTYKTMAYYIGKREKWSIKEYDKEEQVYTGWVRIYNNTVYVCKKDMEQTDVPRPDDANPSNDSTFWALVTDWNRSTLYHTGDYVTYVDANQNYSEIYRIDHDVVLYNSATTYSAGAVVMHDTWMCVSLVDDNNHDIYDETYWYHCKNEDECFNAQDWDQIQSLQKETTEMTGDVQNNSTSGLDRRELFVDATNVPSSYTYYPDPTKNDQKEYIVDEGVFRATLKDKALSELTIPACRPTKNFDCEVETNASFKFGKDYYIGSIIEVKDTYGYVDSVVVNSYIISHNESGFTAYPTFESVESSTIVTKYLTTDQALSTGTFLVKIPEYTEFHNVEEIATSVLKDQQGHVLATYYLISFRKRIKTEASFGNEITDREMHLVAWTTDKNVYDNWEYQSSDEALKTHPTIVGEPLFYIDIEGGVRLPGIINPSWLPPSNVDLGVITSVTESASQYKNILLANL